MSAKKKQSFQEPLKIPYKTFPGSGNILWPTVEVKLSYKGVTIPQSILALVDSGASNSVLHPYIAETLGFDLKKLGRPKTGTGVGGTHETWLLPEPIEFSIAGNTFIRTFSVINNSRLLWPCILGEDTIFTSSRIDFYKFNNYFEVRFRSDIN